MDDHRFPVRYVAFMLVCRPALTSAFHVSAAVRSSLTKCPRKCPKDFCTRSSTNLPMGLYEDEIDWDADLFGQIGTSSDSSVGVEFTNNKDNGTESDALDDTKWDMGQSKSDSNSVDSMREQMKQSWGGVDREGEEGKPTADWMPRFGKGPDEDEPWFTG
eukprot:CAMPEP_0172545142 /NCGR_PEP_ID=MMETSP1067-20121228/15143_1 /TAXON_ID=265564 ORGANISM="Thalassiosira punctigera, Strain Tpunct2005C2" /NCGR_SAMPLE_ID=MMETSP1067 /ASSEMBLY_ACC=CAM_ASM_000444 /LENGTH=159 /DNA_ID=CAMNT_0013331831 /DNA_START=309 /DNA_END=788 /DNA_ORIENTATION=-